MKKIRLTPLLLHKVISLISLAILVSVQANLIYNTYELKNKQYRLDEKSLIDHAYQAAIRNEKLYPGGRKIIDSLVQQNMGIFEELYFTNPKQFERFQHQICRELFIKLRKSSTMDTLFNSIKQQNNLPDDLTYLLTLNALSITFDGVSYISLYQQEQAYHFLPTEITEIKEGIVIDGKLSTINKENLTTSLSISTPTPKSYQITFSLFVDHKYRQGQVLRQMIPTLSLSLSSIIFVLLIYYFTYRNWLKQKKLAEMKSDFLNSITHEFNTPLTAILVANKSLQNKEIVANGKNILSLTAVIQRQTDRLQALINQALDITTMSIETIEKSEYELNKLLEEIINDYKLKTTEKVYIEFLHAPLPSPVPLNRFLLTTMLYNIFDNAIKYNEAEIKRIKVITASNDTHVTITVKDNGVGMSKKMTTAIFEKFYRGKNNQRTGGLGLGLFYVKQSLEIHGWSLNVWSKEGEGSEFCIFIPVST
ncbi:HAMP domain-containing sensor histidine kinase [Olivibacter ginsenosidimutans]|uniref:histidine kinase n=1 Tax=Olivibacter ginsenosidimutans TaxID=1176537 RepID=A0ABP9AE11_9SPHI